MLLEPENPMNTGNIARTCAATGSRLHLIRPLGFDISDRAVKRAGLDYWHLVDLAVYDNLEAFSPRIRIRTSGLRRPRHPAVYGSRISGRLLSVFRERDERPSGLFSQPVIATAASVSRCAGGKELNLANSVAVIAYEALRQTGFSGLLETGEMKNDMEWNRTMEKGS